MRSLNLAIVVAATGLLLACPPEMSSDGTATGPSAPLAPSGAEDGTTLAKVGGTVITVESFEEKINKQSPFIRSRFTDVEKRREYLDNQIRFELLAQEAQRRGIDRQPDVRESLKKIMVQKLTREEFDNRVKLEDVTDAEIETYYGSHGEDYHKPEMVRVAHIFFPFGDAKPKAKVAAQKVLRELQSRKDDRMAFRELAKTHSADEQTKNSGGDLRYLSQQDYTDQYGEVVASAVFDLVKLNDLSPVVEGREGFHIFKQTGRRQAIDRSLDQVRTQIRNRLYRDKRTEAFNSFIDELRNKAGVTVDEERLAALNIVGAAQPVQAATPPGVPAGPRPGSPAPVAAPAPKPAAPAPKAAAPAPKAAAPAPKAAAPAPKAAAPAPKPSPGP